jgi:hypothetical protein
MTSNGADGLDLPELQQYLDGADHVDVRSATSTANLREVIAGAAGWQPFWLRVLFGVRVLLARALRLDQPDIPESRGGRRLRPEDVSFTPGDKVAFFTVADGAEDRYLVFESSDNHLTGWLAITREPVAAGNLYRAITIVRYHRRAGRFYFNLIRPFHHLIMRQMVAAGTQSRSATR